MERVERRVRVALPAHLRHLAGVIADVEIALTEPVTQRAVVDALEATYPALKGTIRDPATGRRRPFIRFFAEQADLSHDEPDALLPAAVREGREVYFVVGAIAGGCDMAKEMVNPINSGEPPWPCHTPPKIATSAYCD